MIRRVALIVVSIVPGVGPILLGRELWGSLLLFGGLNAWNLAALGTFFLITDPPWLWGAIGVVLAVAASVTSVVWTALLTSPARCRWRQEQADRAWKAACLAFLRGRVAEAGVAVEAGLQVAPEDPDLCFLRWFLASHRAGERVPPPRAPRRRWRRHDRKEKWTWEVQREEELLASEE